MGERAFVDAKLQLKSYNPETEKTATMSIANLVANAPVQEVLGVRDAVATLKDEPIIMTLAQESYEYL